MSVPKKLFERDLIRLHQNYIASTTVSIEYINTNDQVPYEKYTCAQHFNALHGTVRMDTMH